MKYLVILTIRVYFLKFFESIFTSLIVNQIIHLPYISNKKIKYLKVNYSTIYNANQRKESIHDVEHFTKRIR